MQPPKHIQFQKYSCSPITFRPKLFIKLTTLKQTFQAAKISINCHTWSDYEKLCSILIAANIFLKTQKL